VLKHLEEWLVMVNYRIYDKKFVQSVNTYHAVFEFFFYLLQTKIGYI